MSAVERALAWRARAALEAGPGHPDGASAAPTPELSASLRHHLLAGETHYPDRPGMVELRRRVGAALPRAGYPERGPDGVLITASEGESLFVTLLGLGAGAGTRFTGTARKGHQRLFDWMGLAVAARGETEVALHYQDQGRGTATSGNEDDPFDSEIPRIHAMGDRLFSSAAASAASPGALGVQEDALEHAIVIGSLDGLDGMRPFRLGFVAAEPKTLAGITKWKQASSICSPAPSQRAALWALGVRP